MPQMTQFLSFSTPKFWEAKIGIDLNKRKPISMTSQRISPYFIMQSLKYYKTLTGL